MFLSIQDFNEHDQRIWDEELEGFVPRRVSDAHIHMLHRGHFTAAKQEAYRNWSGVSFSDLQTWSQNCIHNAKLTSWCWVHPRVALMFGPTIIIRSRRSRQTPSRA